MVTICTIAQMAMYIKKKIEARRDRIAASTNNDGTNSIRISPNCMNNQRLNQYLCTTAGMLFLLLTIFIIFFTSNMISFYNFILNYFKFNLNRDEKMLLTQDFVEISLNLCIPLYMYWKNDALFDHLAHEILNIPHYL